MEKASLVIVSVSSSDHGIARQSCNSKLANASGAGSPQSPSIRRRTSSRSGLLLRGMTVLELARSGAILEAVASKAGIIISAPITAKRR